MSSEGAKPLGVRIAERVLDATESAKGKGSAVRALARNGGAFPIAYFAPELASDQERSGNPDKARELERLGQRAQRLVDELK